MSKGIRRDEDRSATTIDMRGGMAIRAVSDSIARLGWSDTGCSETVGNDRTITRVLWNGTF
ncbi:MAG: hypothetical protein R3C03_11585 [Pirellulaceae bacterium]